MTILHLDASISGENSASRSISRSIVDQLVSADENRKVVYRCLTANPLPHLPLDAFADKSVLSEFLDAGTVVIGAPMCNLTVSRELKAWIDRILVAGGTFRYTGKGPESFASGKRVIVALARDGVRTNGSPTASLEHLQTYLRGVFNFIGIEPEFAASDGR